MRQNRIRQHIAMTAGVAAVCIARAADAQGANWPGYTSWPTNPLGAYNEALPAHPPGFSMDAAVVAVQTRRGADLRAAIQKAIDTKATHFEVPRNVYRFAEPGAIINVLRVSNFKVTAAGSIFIFAGTGQMLVSGTKFESDPGAGYCSDITIQGNPGDPLIIDRENLGCQGRITAYDPGVGVLTVRVSPGYSTDVRPADAKNGLCVTAYHADGTDIPFGYYHDLYGRYSDVKVYAVHRTVQVTLSDAGDRLDAAHRYSIGNYVTLPSTGDTGGVLAEFLRTEAHNLTLRDIVNGTGKTLLDLWSGKLSGDARLIRVQNGAPPGTNRLGTSPCLAGSSTSHDNVVVDGCEFGDSYDDSMDIQGNGFKMVYKTESPNQIVGWNLYGGIGYKTGDRVSVFANGNFANVLTARVTAVEPYPDPTGSEVVEASKIWNSLRRRQKSGGSLVLLTLDRAAIGPSPGDYLENDSERMKSMTIKNCYWHNVGVRVMIEGIDHGVFTHNLFDGVNGGLAVTSDPYWAQGGTCRNVVIDNNIFRNSKVDYTNNNIRGALVLGPLWGSGPLLPGQHYAFENFTVTNNTILDTGGPSISAHMVGHLRIAGNVVKNPTVRGGVFDIAGDGNAVIANNQFFGVVGPVISLKGCNGVRTAGNSVDGGPAGFTDDHH
jgi:hypothetical protein